MKRELIVGAAAFLLMALTAGAGDDLPAHWTPTPWYLLASEVEETGEEHVVFDFEQGSNYIVKTTWRDPAVPNSPLIPAFRVKDLSTGVVVVIFRRNGGPLDMVNISGSFDSPSKFGNVSLSPFRDSASGTPVVLQVVSTGSFGSAKAVARVSMEMADSFGSDLDTWQMTLQQNASATALALGPRPVLTTEDGEMERSIKWGQSEVPVGYVTFLAGSADTNSYPFVLQLNSMYYDNIVLTFQTNYGATVGRGSDAPASDFGGGGDSDVTNGAGQTDEEEVVVDEEDCTLDGLMEKVKELDLDKGRTTSLLAKLENAASLLAKGQVGAAVNAIESFISEVEAQSGKDIDSAAAGLLADYAEQVIALYDGG